MSGTDVATMPQSNRLMPSCCSRRRSPPDEMPTTAMNTLRSTEFMNHTVGDGIGGRMQRAEPAEEQSGAGRGSGTRPLVGHCADERTAAIRHATPNYKKKLAAVTMPGGLMKAIVAVSGISLRAYWTRLHIGREKNRSLDLNQNAFQMHLLRLECGREAAACVTVLEAAMRQRSIRISRIYLMRAEDHARTARPDGVEQEDRQHISVRRRLDKLRDAIFASQKRFGVIALKAKLTPWPVFLKRCSAARSAEGMLLRPPRQARPDLGVSAK